jgi:hypothetical protein
VAFPISDLMLQEYPRTEQQKYQVLGALPKQILQSLEGMTLLLQVIRRSEVHTCFKDYVKRNENAIYEKVQVHLST